MIGFCLACGEICYDVIMISLLKMFKHIQTFALLPSYDVIGRYSKILTQMTQTRSFRETLLMINAIQSKEGYLFSEFTFPRKFKLKILNFYLESNRCDLGALDFCHLPSLYWTRTKLQVRYWRYGSRIQYLVIFYLNSQELTQRCACHACATSKIAQTFLLLLKDCLLICALHIYDDLAPYGDA